MTSTKYLRHVLAKIKHEPLSGVLLRAQKRVNITIEPYYLFEGGIFRREALPLDIDLSSCEIRSLGADDMSTLAAKRNGNA